MPWDFWLIFLFLSAVIPWRGHARLKKLLALPSVDTKEKMSLYAVTIAFQWALTGMILWRGLARGMRGEDFGLGPKNWAGIVVTGAAGGAVIAGLQWLNLRRIGKMDGAAPELLCKLASRLLPVNRLEYLSFASLAITAGVCEEFIYRGFAMAALTRVGWPLWLVVVMTSVLFGLVHAYQGRGGILSTGIFGVVLAIRRIVCGSVVPVMM